MKLIFKALLIAFLIGAALAILQLILLPFGNYIIAIGFYYLIIFPSAFVAFAFEGLFGINLRDNQTFFAVFSFVTLYLLFAFFIYCLLWTIKWINSSK